MVEEVEEVSGHERGEFGEVVEENDVSGEEFLGLALAERADERVVVGIDELFEF